MMFHPYERLSLDMMNGLGPHAAALGEVESQPTGHRSKSGLHMNVVVIMCPDASVC